VKGKDEWEERKGSVGKEGRDGEVREG